MPSFLSLPSELRLVIYGYLLDDAIASNACILWAPDVLEGETDTISVSHHRITTSAKDPFDSFGFPPTCSTLSHVDFRSLAMLGQISRLIRGEVMPFIWSHMCLSLHGPRYGSVEILRAVRSCQPVNQRYARTSTILCYHSSELGKSGRDRVETMKAFVSFVTNNFPGLRNLNSFVASPTRCIILDLSFMKLPSLAKKMFGIQTSLPPEVLVKYDLHILSSINELVALGLYHSSDVERFREKAESLPPAAILNLQENSTKNGFSQITQFTWKRLSCSESSSIAESMHTAT
ncbi:hypothetical protein E4T39_06677 [Aureobasidium subglaciale]|nr:hypothetical protein E4T39_06677 [Aureobasidium subglaciale]